MRPLPFTPSPSHPAAILQSATGGALGVLRGPILVPLEPDVWLKHLRSSTSPPQCSTTI